MKLQIELDNGVAPHLWQMLINYLWHSKHPLGRSPIYYIVIISSKLCPKRQIYAVLMKMTEEPTCRWPSHSSLDVCKGNLEIRPLPPPLYSLQLETRKMTRSQNPSKIGLKCHQCVVEPKRLNFITVLTMGQVEDTSHPPPSSFFLEMVLKHEYF